MQDRENPRGFEFWLILVGIIAIALWCGSAWLRGEV
jgi:hypothetical protein